MSNAGDHTNHLVHCEATTVIVDGEGLGIVTTISFHNCRSNARVRIMRESAATVSVNLLAICLEISSNGERHTSAPMRIAGRS